MTGAATRGADWGFIKNMVREHIYNGTTVLIEEAIMNPLKELIIEFSPELIIELGTYQGGLVKYLSEWFANIQIYSFDKFWMISKKDQDYLREKGNVTIIIQDIFNGNAILPVLLSLPKRKVLFCDDGNKICEVKSFAGYLMPGDIIAIHDWGYEVNYGDIWHILEEFDPHPINEKFSVPGASTMRLWIKKGYHHDTGIPKIYRDVEEKKNNGN